MAADHSIVRSFNKASPRHLCGPSILERATSPAVGIQRSPRHFLEAKVGPSMIGIAGHGNVDAGQSTFATEQLFASAREELARLCGILRCQSCIAVMRGIDGVVMPLEATPPGDSLRSRDASALSTPIDGTDGKPLASIEVFLDVAQNSGACGTLLSALIESSARAIGERWFRVVYRRQWIVAAMRRDAPGTYVLLAIGKNQRLMGANRHARQVLEARGLSFDNQLELSALFQAAPDLFLRRSCRDVPTMLLSAGGGEAWIALITPPDVSAIDSGHDGHSTLHTRPRLDSLPHSAASSTRVRMQRGLSARALKQIEEYVDAHLDSPLEIEELAAVVGMSSSNFARAFRNSVGLTPHKYVIRHRVMGARELLTTTHIPLTEIALMLGFFDQSHLSRRFQELVGKPPGAFRVEERL